MYGRIEHDCCNMTNRCSTGSKSQSLFSSVLAFSAQNIHVHVLCDLGRSLNCHLQCVLCGCVDVIYVHTCFCVCGGDVCVLVCMCVCVVAVVRCFSICFSCCD